MILFHDSGYRCLKHFYLDKVCKHLRHLFPEVVSYNRFVEFIYGKLVGDNKGYISKSLFQRLFVDGIQLITKLKSNMRGALMSLSDKQLLQAKLREWIEEQD
ncbi:DDE family transposase [Bacteroides zoogleoformans]|nr:DDE family transposase [Bacteroides zoogleoformans]